MKLGFLTACMPRRSLAEICAWARANDFEALEVAAWPDLGDRPFTATHLVVDGFGAGDAESSARCSPITTSSAPPWRTTTTTSIPTPRRAQR